jgi:hypothetical protein
MVRFRLRAFQNGRSSIGQSRTFLSAANVFSQEIIARKSPNTMDFNTGWHKAAPQVDRKAGGVAWMRSQRLVARDHVVEFSHSLETQIGGQLKGGFLLRGFFED